MTVVIDNGANEAITIDATAPDARSQMLASAAQIASIVIDTEGKLADSAKAWGHALFRAVHVDGLNMDSMIGDTKVAAGWGTLALSDAGKKAKQRLEVYFSNARLVAENWSSFDDAKRAELLAGLSSIHYVANQLRKAKADADKAAKKAAALAKAEQDAADAKGEAADSATNVATPEPVAFDPFDAMASLAFYFANMNDDQAADVGSHVAAMMATYDARINILIDAGAVEPVAVAA